MMKRNKYDVMTEMVIDSQKNIEDIISELGAAQLKCWLGMISEDELQIISKKGMLPILTLEEAVNNCWYETTQDLKNVDPTFILDYCREQGRSFVDFAFMYNERKLSLHKSLYSYALVARSDYDLTSEDDLMIIDRLISGSGGFDFVATRELDPSRKALLEMLPSDDCDYMRLTSSQLQMVDDYHSTYMNEHIFPLSTTKTDDEQVMQFVKRFTY